jgi:site-specific DNA-methyltransferase (adenine-specific)
MKDSRGLSRNRRFFRFLVYLRKVSLHATKQVYSFVPAQDFTESWIDEKLYQKYGLTPEEITFINSLIRPMELK